MVKHRDQNARSLQQRFNNSSFEVWNSSIFGINPNKNQNSIQEEIRSRLKDRECLLSSGAEFFVFQFTI